MIFELEKYIELCSNWIWLIWIQNSIHHYSQIHSKLNQTTIISVYLLHVSTFIVGSSCSFGLSIRIGLLYTTVWIFSNSCSIREKNVLLSASIFNCFHTILLNPLNRSISEDAFLFTVCENTFYCAIRESVKVKSFNYIKWL